MRKSVMALVVSSFVVLNGDTTRAGTLWDIDIFLKYLSEQATYNNYFDITGKYDPSSESVIGAQAWFVISDDLIDWSKKDEEAAIYLGNRYFRGSRDVDFNFLGGEISGDALVTLDTTGMLKYTFRAVEGDLLALSAKLQVETAPRRVPDGGATLMLLGLALAGIEPLRRRMARRRSSQPKTS